MDRWNLRNKEEIHATVILEDNKIGFEHLMGDKIGESKNAMVFNCKNLNSGELKVIRFRIPFSDDTTEILHYRGTRLKTACLSIEDIEFYNKDGEIIEE